jgi:AhpD family alkylhydroperoxidase
MIRSLALAFVLTASAATAGEVDATRADIQATLGIVPSFINDVAEAALPGLWAATKGLEFSETALDMKTKALVSLAVSAQIPCSYCIWLETNSARAHGATDEEIAEAVALAAETRAWSTIFNGMQVDLATFKSELGSQ